MRKNKTIIIIPAREKSSRLPNKMLLKETGKFLVQHTWENCVAVMETYIATDSKNIATAANSFGANVIMTGQCSCGTQRVYEASKNVNANAIINVQGDAPNVRQDSLLEMASKLTDFPVISMCYKDKKNDPSRVKVMLDHQENAVWNSRHVYMHIGVYGFQKSFLEKYVNIEDTINGRTEGLEQLRLLESGYSMHMIISDHCYSIDTKKDYEDFVHRNA